VPDHVLHLPELLINLVGLRRTEYRFDVRLSIRRPSYGS
jgi:hypothetical protein